MIILIITNNCVCIFTDIEYDEWSSQSRIPSILESKSNQNTNKKYNNKNENENVNEINLNLLKSNKLEPQLSIILNEYDNKNNPPQNSKYLNNNQTDIVRIESQINDDFIEFNKKVRNDEVEIRSRNVLSEYTNQKVSASSITSITEVDVEDAVVSENNYNQIIIDDNIQKLESNPASNSGQKSGLSFLDSIREMNMSKLRYDLFLFLFLSFIYFYLLHYIVDTIFS